MKRIISFILALACFISLSITVHADLLSEIEEEMNESPISFEPSTAFNAEKAFGFTADDWFKDDVSRATLAACLLADVISADSTLEKDFTLDDIVTDGHIAKSDEQSYTAAWLYIDTDNGTLAIRYIPYAGIGEYRIYPAKYGKNNFTGLLDLTDIPYWEINKDSLVEAVLIMMGSSQATNEYTSGERLSTDEIIAMSNYMNEGRFIISGNWMYGTNYYNTNAALSRRSISNLSDSKYINKGVNPLYLFKEGSWIYYLAIDLYHDNSTSIRRVPLSGESEEVIISENDLPDVERITSLFSYDDQLYFSVTCHNGGRLYRANSNGRGITSVKDDGAVGHPFIANNKLFYLKTFSNNLFVSDIDGNNAVKLTSNVLSYITDGVNIYRENILGVEKYSVVDASTELLNLKTNGNGFAYDGVYIYYPNADDKGRLYSYNTNTQEINNISDDPYVGYITILREGTLCYFQFSEDYQYVNHIYYINFDGSQKGTIF